MGFRAYHAAKWPIDYAVSDIPAALAGISAGFLLGIVVYGALTALAVALSLRLEGTAGEEHQQIAR